MSGAVLAQLIGQAADKGADLVTLRAIAEEAGELGATRALKRLGLSARGVLMTALTAQLRGASGLSGVAVFDAPPVRGGVPHLVIEEPVMTARDAAGVSVLDVRVTLTGVDAGERPVRLRTLMDAAEAATTRLPADLGEGWRAGAMTLVRSRIVRAGDTRWRGTSEWAVRLYRLAS